MRERLGRFVFFFEKIVSLRTFFRYKDDRTDYYTILEVNKNATKEEIKKYHPDTAPYEQKEEFENKMKEINKAKEILLDKNKRKSYDEKRK